MGPYAIIALNCGIGNPPDIPLKQEALFNQIIGGAGDALGIVVP